MRIKNLPALDLKYWAAIVCASVLGTTFGDFVSGDVALGFGGALLPLGVILAVIFFAEAKSPWTSVFYYWAAIVFTRTAATNLGDYLARSLHLGYGPVSVVMALATAALLVFFRLRAARSGKQAQVADTGRKMLPTTDAPYWVAMLMVSSVGTTFGDYVADDLGFGLAKGSLLTATVLAAALVVEFLAKRPSEVRYWVIIAIVRTTGTDLGDWLSSEEGLDLGFAKAASLAAAVLLTILLLPGRTESSPRTSTAPNTLGGPLDTSMPQEADGEL